MRGVSFLHTVAGSLLSRFGNNLSEIVVVFPGKRAKLFLNQYLYQYFQAPLWSPQYKTIESLFQESSSLQIGEEIQLITELYLAYIKVHNRRNPTPSKETLDEFFFFGETLLKDFDEVDKNRVNTSLLFGNLQDWDALRDRFSHLSENQIQTLLHHFKGTFQGNSVLQTNFRNIWSLLEEVYTCFKEQLQQKNLAYPGMLMRQVIEQTEIPFSGKHYAFVGFNALNRCEECLFRQLKEKASFYWDYDRYYLHTEAGRFIEKNIRSFGSALKEEWFDNFLHTNQKITLIASPFQSGQSAVISRWIDNSISRSSCSLSESAIILCDETILPTIMHVIPSGKVENVNITMGFPLLQTAIGSFMQLWIEMQTKGYRSSNESFSHTYVLSILRHSYGRLLLPNAMEIEKEILQKNIFSPTFFNLQEEELFAFAPDTLSLIRSLIRIVLKISQSQKNSPANCKDNGGLEKESVFRAYLMLNRLHFLFSSDCPNLGKQIFLRLFRKYLSKIKVPFEGEPLQGLQIMGVLETRTLDFKHVLLLSANEGTMPVNHSENTFIPPLLRKHFGMSTLEHNDSVYAYYFYRLISRAEKATLVYTTHETPTGKAEMSRFLLQLLVDTRLKNRIERFALQSNNIPFYSPPVRIDKKGSLMKKIKEKYDLTTNPNAQSLSPSALSCWMDCSYRFYLEYIQGLKKTNDSIPEIDHSLFGSLFHRSAELLYRHIGIKRVIYSETLEKYVHSPQKIRARVLEAFQKEIFKGRFVSEKDYNGKQLINVHILCKMLDRLLRFDQKQTPFTILGLELPVNGTFKVLEGKSEVKIKGIIDRLQKDRNEKHRIIDYKTGDYKKLSLRNVDDWFESKNRPIFQTMVYATLYMRKEKQAPIVPALLYIQQLDKSNYSSTITYNGNPLEESKEWGKTFSHGLAKKIEELFDPTIPFLRTDNFQTCHYCPFKERCNR